MEEGKKASNTEVEIALRRQLLEVQRKQFYEEFNEMGVDLVKNKKYSDMFSDGIKEGTVRVEPHADGTASLFVDINTPKGELMTKKLAVNNKNEAAFLNGLQITLNPPKLPEVK